MPRSATSADRLEPCVGRGDEIANPHIYRTVADEKRAQTVRWPLGSRSLEAGDPAWPEVTREPVEAQPAAPPTGREYRHAPQTPRLRRFPGGSPASATHRAAAAPCGTALTTRLDNPSRSGGRPVAGRRRGALWRSRRRRVFPVPRHRHAPAPAG